MALEILLLEENIGTKYDEKKVKGEKIEANGDVSCPRVSSVKWTWVEINQSEKSKSNMGILKPAEQLTKG